MFVNRKKFLLFLIISIFINCKVYSPCLGKMCQEAIDKGFVYLDEVDPTIICSLRYNTNENFLGRRIAGYKESRVILTKEAAEALKEAQKKFKKDGYCIVVYDAYRPQEAVNDFIKWSEDINEQTKKSQYYPRIDKAKVFELGYVAKRSGHTRGSTVDLTIKKDDTSLHEVKKTDRKLLDGFTIKYLDDGTVDMGSSFDLCDVASHYENNLIADDYKKSRKYLKDTMESCGFKPYSQEWWHFTYKNEPYPADKDSSYHNFPVE